MQLRGQVWPGRSVARDPRHVLWPRPLGRHMSLVALCPKQLLFGDLLRLPRCLLDHPEEVPVIAARDLLGFLSLGRLLISPDLLDLPRCRLLDRRREVALFACRAPRRAMPDVPGLNGTAAGPPPFPPLSSRTRALFLSSLHALPRSQCHSSCSRSSSSPSLDAQRISVDLLFSLLMSSVRTGQAPEAVASICPKWPGKLLLPRPRKGIPGCFFSAKLPPRPRVPGLSYSVLCSDALISCLQGLAAADWISALKLKKKERLEEWPGDETWGIGEKLGLETGRGEGELRASSLSKSSRRRDVACAAQWTLALHFSMLASLLCS